MNGSIIFVKGTYRKDSISFYTNLCRKKFKVAANGGCAFFRKSGLIPDLIIGDFDSTAVVNKVAGPKTKLIKYSPDKDKTDSALALEYCLTQKFRTIDIVMPSLGEPDHMLGNFLLMAECNVLQRRNRSKVRLINQVFECRVLKDAGTTISNSIGETVSVIPISATIHLTCSGMKYPARSKAIQIGSSAGMRNLVASKQARISVRGTALIIRQYVR